MKRARREKGAVKRTVLLLLFLLAGLGVFAWVQNRPETEAYSENAVSLLEIKEALSFGVYEGADWDALFGNVRGEYLTEEILSQLLEKLGVEAYIEMPKTHGGRVTDRETWIAVYTQILDLLDMGKEVTAKNLLILDVLEAEDGSILVTHEGEYKTKLPQTYFRPWQGYIVYCIAERCIGISCESGDTFFLQNAYIRTCAENKVEFLYAGTSYQKEISGLQAEIEGGVCDIGIKEQKISALRMKQETIEGELLSYDEEFMEIAGYGRLAHPEKLPVYQTYGEVTEKSLSDVVLGNMQVTYVTGEQEVCAILLRQPAKIQDIRVLLLAEDGTAYRTHVFLKSDKAMALACGTQTQTVAAGTIVEADAYFAGGRTETLLLEPETADGQIFLCDAAGNAISNGYQGTLEVRSYAQGYTVVNDVPFETYLCAVVPSEMPSEYAPEALKAQAVCARSYAYRQLLRADLAIYGAHIDDSTSYQVYNKTPVTDAARRAVAETAGKMLLYEGMPVEAYYFSTSMGYTDTAEIWNVDDLAAYGYLKAVCLNKEKTASDLSDEQEFLAYISQPAEGYDSESRYFRWFACADYRDKTEQINQVLISRRAVSPKNICFLEKDGGRELAQADAKQVAALGRIVGIKAAERSPSGAILTLEIQYENGSARIKNEYTIRRVLGLCVEKIVYADASENTAVTLLPSAFCALCEQADGTLLLQGGGYGHGLGMSQNGANGMAKAGMNYEEILQYFYRDVTISSIE